MSFTFSQVQPLWAPNLSAPSREDPVGLRTWPITHSCARVCVLTHWRFSLRRVFIGHLQFVALSPALIAGALYWDSIPSISIIIPVVVIAVVFAVIAPVDFRTSTLSGSLSLDPLRFEAAFQIDFIIVVHDVSYFPKVSEILNSRFHPTSVGHEDHVGFVTQFFHHAVGPSPTRNEFRGYSTRRRPTIVHAH